MAFDAKIPKDVRVLPAGTGFLILMQAPPPQIYSISLSVHRALQRQKQKVLAERKRGEGFVSSTGRKRLHAQLLQVRP